MVVPKYHSDTWLEHDDITIKGKRVKLYGWDTVNSAWVRVAVNDDGYVLISDGEIMKYQNQYVVEGVAQLNELVVDGIYFGNDSKIIKIGIFARTVSDTTDFKVDILKDGVALSKEATLSAGSQYEETDIVDETYITTERFGMKITQVGDNDTPVALIITVHWEKV